MKIFNNKNEVNFLKYFLNNIFQKEEFIEDDIDSEEEEEKEENFINEKIVTAEEYASCFAHGFFFSKLIF